MSGGNDQKIDFYDQAYVVSRVQQYLTSFFDQNIQKAHEHINNDYAELWKVIANVTLAGGKRLRPYLCLVTYGALGGKSFEDVLPVAVALELLHQCLLIHDDVIDRDYIRHGQKNVAGQMRDTYQQLRTGTEHYADSAAILAGDLLLSSSYQLIQSSSIVPELKHAVTQYMAEAVFVVGGGELSDTISVLKPLESVDSISVAIHKTSSYSFIAPMAIGAVLAAASEAQITLFRTIGQNLGIAYQLKDDLLGIFGDYQLTGKSTLSDIREGKRTYLMQQGMLLGSPEQQRILRACLGNHNLQTNEAEQVVSILDDSGARAATETLITNYINECSKLLAELGLEEASLKIFSLLIHKASMRAS